MAQQSAGTVTESVTTRRDLNGRDAVSEKVVTHRDRTKDEERVVIETYAPLIYADRLELNRRVRRVTTVTQDGVRPSRKPKNAILARRASHCESFSEA